MHPAVWRRNLREVNQKSDGVPFGFYITSAFCVFILAITDSHWSPDGSCPFPPFSLIQLYVCACINLINIQFLYTKFLYILHDFSYSEVCFFCHQCRYPSFLLVNVCIVCFFKSDAFKLFISLYLKDVSYK